MNTLTELAERVERLTGPCRETDGLIFKALEQRDGDVWTTFGDDNVWHRRDPKDRVAYDPPPDYTRSLDAAMTLARSNREAMLMFHVAFREYESDESNAPPNLFPQIRAMLAYHLRARASMEDQHG